MPRSGYSAPRRCEAHPRHTERPAFSISARRAQRLQKKQGGGTMQVLSEGAGEAIAASFQLGWRNVRTEFRHFVPCEFEVERVSSRSGYQTNCSEPGEAPEALLQQAIRAPDRLVPARFRSSARHERARRRGSCDSLPRSTTAAHARRCLRRRRVSRRRCGSRFRVRQRDCRARRAKRR
jgi:hypothetical protein